MYFTDWHTTTPQTLGPIKEYTVFAKGDAIKPTTKGAVLRYVDSYVYESLAPNASSPKTTLSGQQRESTSFCTGIDFGWWRLGSGLH